MPDAESPAISQNSVPDAFTLRVSAWASANPDPFPAPPGYTREAWDLDRFVSATALNWVEVAKRDRDVIDVRGRNEAGRKGWVYFIGSEAGSIKIGFTANVEQRLRRLTANSPHPLRVLASKRGTMSDERDYHLKFFALRQHGEWFERHPDILAEIERLGA